VFATGSVSIAAGNDVIGSVTVDGPASNLTTNLALSLGAGTNSSALLRISNGGTVNSFDANIGMAGGSSALVVIDGGSWHNGGPATNIGVAGEAEVNLSNGGLLDADGGTGTIQLAVQAGSVGVLNIGEAALNPAAAAGTINAFAINIGAGTGTINFNHTDTNYTFAPAIAGNGTINQFSGTTVLTGPNDGFHGTAFVTGGKLIVINSFEHGTVDVSGGLFGGTGLVGDIVANSGGTVAPGTSIGTMSVVNDITFNSGSIYQVEVNNAGQSDELLVGGIATINGGNVQIVAANGQYAANTTYTILNATGGRNGTFDGVSANYAFLTPTLSYDANNVYLNLASNGIAFASIAQTPNQRAVANNVDSLGGGNGIYDAVQGLDAASAQAAYDSLSGEIHASTTGALINNAHYLNDAVLGRLRGVDISADNPQAHQFATTDNSLIGADGPANSRSLWGQAFGGWSETDGDGNAAKIDNTTAGFLIGLDGEVAPGWRLGLATGYSHSSLDVAARQSDASVDSFHIAAYGGGHVGPVSLRMGAAYSFNNIDSSRNVDVGGISDHDKASYNAHMAQVFGEIGYDARIGNVALEPFAGMSYVNLSTEGFTEHGGSTALKSRSSNQDLPASTLGLRAGADIAQIGTAKLSATGMLGWRHAFGDVTSQSSFDFAGSSDRFTISGTPIARNALVAQAGIDLAIDRQFGLGLSYSGQVADDARDNAVQGKLNWQF
jgi:outer membrane autotransporter protein